MIRVNRARVRMPSALAETAAKAANERQAAEAFYTGPPPPKKPSGELARFKFTAYKDDSIKRALEALFHGKCAYCEIFYAASQPVDVEHWRPKAAVNPEAWEGTDALPGYYWLASDWNNLLPSCIDCNRVRSHRQGSQEETRTSGKGNRFPIAEGSKRARALVDLSAEEPLLLNPCTDKPDEHLAWLGEDQCFVYDRTIKGRTSIDVYGLNRAGLVTARREHAHRIRERLWRIMRLFEARARSRNEVIAEILEDLLRNDLRELARARRDSEPFSSMSRAMIDAFMRSQIDIGP